MHVRVRIESEVHRGLRRVCDTESRIADYTDNLVLAIAEGTQVLADRIFSRKDLPGKRFGDDDLGGVAGTLIVVEGIAA